MATTTYGTEYVQSSDLVSNWPGSSLSVANRIDDVSLKGNGLNNQTGTTYTLVLTDGGKIVTLNNASAVSVTIPTNASVAFPTGVVIGFTNKGAGTVTLAGAGGVTVNGASLTLAQNESCTALKLDTNTWVVSKGGGIPKADFSDAATGTYTGYKYITFFASGTLTITQAGLADLVICGGGGRGGTGIGQSGAGGGGGAGGFANLTDAYLPAGTLTVTVGGATGPSRIGPYVSPAGGQGGDAVRPADNGGSGGGGGGGAAAAGGTALVSYGNDGGTTSGGTGGASGGGGAGAVGTNSSSSLNGGAGGAGSSTSIAGTTPNGAYVAGSYSFGGGDFPASEPVGQAFINGPHPDCLALPGTWLQCSYNGNFRGAYPDMGWSYDPDLDQFIPPPSPEPAA
jgi:hypothetical protein